MADNTEESKAQEQNPAEENAPVEEIDTGMTGDQSFAFWIVLLPFIAFAGVQLYEYSQNPESVKLINAAGLVISGIFAAYFVHVLTSGDQSTDENKGDEPKTEGTSSS